MSGRAGRGRVRAALRSAFGSLCALVGPHPPALDGQAAQWPGVPGAMMGQ
jgi:hypothetical protein